MAEAAAGAARGSPGLTCGADGEGGDDAQTLRDAHGPASSVASVRTTT